MLHKIYPIDICQTLNSTENKTKQFSNVHREFTKSLQYLQQNIINSPKIKIHLLH